MRFMIVVKATKDTEAGNVAEEKTVCRDDDLPRGTGKGGSAARCVRIATDVRRAGASGTQGRKRTVIDGPFTETKELIAGYTIIQVKSREEALEWTKRFPNPVGEERKLRSKCASCTNLRTWDPAHPWNAFATCRGAEELGFGRRQPAPAERP